MFRGHVSHVVQASYRMSDFIWHGNGHYIVFRFCGQQRYCLDDAVISEVDIIDLPRETCLVFLEKTMRLKGKGTGAGPRAAGNPPHPIWMQLPGALAKAAMRPVCRFCEGPFAKRVALKRAIRTGTPRDTSGRQQQWSDRQQAEVRWAIAEVRSATAEVRSETAEAPSATAEVRSATAEVRSATAEVRSAATAEVRSATAEVRSATIAEVLSVTAEVRSATAEVRSATTAEVRSATAEVRSVTAEVRSVTVEVRSGWPGTVP